MVEWMPQEMVEMKLNEKEIIYNCFRRILCRFGLHKFYVKTREFVEDPRIHFFGEFECKYCGKIERRITK